MKYNKTQIDMEYGSLGVTFALYSNVSARAEYSPSQSYTDTHIKGSL